MKFTQEAQKVLWMADHHMTYCNLPSHMVQHWTCVHELNGALTDLVKFLAIGYKANKRPLNPLATPWVNNFITTENILNEKDIVKDVAEEWHAVTKSIKPNDRKPNQVHQHQYRNKFDASQENMKQPEENNDDNAEETYHDGRDNIITHQHYHQPPKHTVDDINIERMNELLEECKLKDMKRCVECEEMKLELDIMAGECCSLERELAHCSPEEMKTNLQCSDMMCFLVGQELKCATKAVEEHIQNLNEKHVEEKNSLTSAVEHLQCSYNE